MKKIFPQYYTIFIAMIVFVVAAQAQNQSRHSILFNIPEGDAADTLMEFAKQSGIGIVYQSTEVSGIETSSVEGQKTPSEALKLMLSDTPLGFRQDDEVSAIAIIRNQTPKMTISSEDSGGNPNGTRLRC